ncbi:MAG: bifunctional UDP-N-acetylglucosamine diphosphorylase/glucosamine-1-phosphate N-acetyltransferase GlmU, partial [Ectothiorhodospiraceae bacterium]|nr:bifunctional UDP-N-acetylglucosamine diphosphorylase/glucosamine-1-phosphate N-acetyltransferase GlmU [Ectothiorhodospiraceae bacterium]
LVTAMDEADLALLTVHLDDPKGYGRIVRDDRGQVLRIVEEKDASPVEREIREVNTGILVARAADLSRWISQIGNDNAQGEFYLTDAIELAVADGRQVQAVVARDAREVMGVNDKRQLAEVERAWQRRQAEALMRDGVTLLDPARFDLRGTLHAGRDVVIDIDVIIEGEVTLGDGVRIGAHTILRDCTIGAGSDIRPHSIVEQAEIGERCLIGPFARIRPDTALADEVHVGNFVELKKARVAAASKINHLSYVGDAEVGARVNIGAGTITCNYDGANKHLTTIGDDAFIGSDTSLVAPVTVGAGATIGAGSVVTRDAPPGELTVTRAKQQTIPGWKRPVKQPKP